MPSQKEQIEKLTAENDELRELVEALTQRLKKLEESHETSDVRHSETLVRLEAVEENLCQVKTECLELRQDQSNLMIDLELQQMYSRKQTLLITGEAVKNPERGEDVRKLVLSLLKEHLGISDLDLRSICACHRLKNPKVILVRFVSLDDSDRVYRARTKPKKRGLMIFESLTSERLAVVHYLKQLKQEENSPVLSYYTQSGRIYVRTSEDREIRPTEIPVGASNAEIRDMCFGKKVDLTPVGICDQFRSIHCRNAPGHPKRPQSGPAKDALGWSKVPAKQKKSADPAAARPDSGQT